MSKGRLLIVDDEEQLVSMCTEAMAAEGYDAYGACHGEEALRLISSDRFDVVITDLVMPQVDGLRLLQRVKEEDPTALVIVITGYASVENAVRAIRQGAYDFLAKPFTVDELAISVERALERRRLEEENRSLKRLTALFQDLKTVGSATDSGELNRLAVEVCLREAEARAGGIAWVVAERLSLGYGQGLPAGIHQGFSIPLEEPIVGEVARTLSPILIEDISEKGQSVERRLYPEGSVVAAPAFAGQGLVGVLFACGKQGAKAFSQTDLTIVSMIAGHTAVARGNVELFHRTRDHFLTTIRTLMATLEARDTYARRHSDRVGDYAFRIATELGLPEETRDSIRTAAYLHDIGKVGIRDEVLLKPGLFTPQDRQVMQQHPAIGSRILSLAEFPSEIPLGVRHHHERPNGEGYPDGLSKLPISPQILAVADAYEALTSDRHYHRARPPREAMAEIEANVGTQFTLEPTRALAAALDKGGELSLAV